MTFMLKIYYLGLTCCTSRNTVLFSRPDGAHVYSPVSDTCNLKCFFFIFHSYALMELFTSSDVKPDKLFFKSEIENGLFGIQCFTNLNLNKIREKIFDKRAISLPIPSSTDGY